MPKGPVERHGIVRTERGEDQPVDKKRAQDPSSKARDKEQSNEPGGQSKQSSEDQTS
jgi:hypothetical protein